jgi:hypothetical protein
MIITDAHAHIYSCYNLDDFISSAFKNLFKGTHNLSEQSNTAVLFLTETKGNNYFDLLMNNTKPWHVVNTDEKLSLRVNHPVYPDKEIIVISGQQVVTEEKLEVLVIGCSYPQVDGATLKGTVNSSLSGGGIVILPWGVGKWLGQRGRIVDDFVAANNSSHLFLGDNGSRPGIWSVSNLDRDRSTNQPRLLSGTDPLPLPGEEKRVGNFGSIIHGSIDHQKPFETLKSLLSHPETDITGYGDLQSPLSFVKQQVALRMAR